MKRLRLLRTLLIAAYALFVLLFVLGPVSFYLPTPVHTEWVQSHRCTDGRQNGADGGAVRPFNFPFALHMTVDCGDDKRMSEPSDNFRLAQASNLMVFLLGSLLFLTGLNVLNKRLHKRHHKTKHPKA